jgi:3',5'-cyclic AMP phosphodiesterase CpdA
VRLWGLSDLHPTHAENLEYASSLPARPDDWLLLAGDVGVTQAHLRQAFELLAPRFAQLVWVPGNHELWTHPTDADARRGEERYLAHVEVCRAYGVLTPEDPYAVCAVDGEPVVVAPLFVLYDYSFRAPGRTKEQALAAARRTNALCADEAFLHPDPYPSREAWCHARARETERRLAAVDPALRTVLVSHFPLRADVVRLPLIPDFAPWCGTTLTEDWHRRFRAAAVVSGHLHVPGTLWRHDVPFSEVSLGYPPQWRRRGAGFPPLAEVPLAARPAVAGAGDRW